jgi:hypothetical protein
MSDRHRRSPTFAGVMIVVCAVIGAAQGVLFTTGILDGVWDRRDIGALLGFIGMVFVVVSLVIGARSRRRKEAEQRGGTRPGTVESKDDTGT